MKATDTRIEIFSVDSQRPDIWRENIMKICNMLLMGKMAPPPWNGRHFCSESMFTALLQVCTDSSVSEAYLNAE